MDFLAIEITAETVAYIMGSYIGVILAASVVADDEDSNKKQIAELLICGTVAWIVGFAVRTFMIESRPEATGLIILALFVMLGVLSYLIFTMLSRSIKDKLIIFK